MEDWFMLKIFVDHDLFFLDIQADMLLLLNFITILKSILINEPLLGLIWVEQAQM